MVRNVVEELTSEIQRGGGGDRSTRYNGICSISTVRQVISIACPFTGYTNAKFMTF